MAGAGTFRRPGRGAAGQRGISLIELLVGMSIMSVITAMILIGWFALGRSYSFSISSADARDYGRQAVSRLQREIRDAEKPDQAYFGAATSAPDAIVYRARPYTIAFTTSFNNAGNDVMDWQSTPTPAAVASTPHLVVYRLYSDGELWRFEDNNENGVIDVIQGARFAMAGDDVGRPNDDWGTLPTDFPLSEQDRGEGRTLILKNVVNYTAHPGSPVPIFEYNHYDGAGTLVSTSQLLGTARYDAIAVQVRLLIDLNPRRAPVYADLRSTAQLRNAR